jgi:CRAL/TRIO, N-terminal domain/CRAL/TRIO domain
MPSYTEMPIPPGHLGNLTPEQELKLRDFWSLTLKTFGVKDPSLHAAAPGISATTPPISEANTDSDSPKSAKKTSSGKKRHSLFGSKKHHDDDTADTNFSHSAPGTGDPDDKYGQTKEFQQTLKAMSPEDLRAAFWSMVKSDHPDALLLRFLRARKWDIQRALVMLISTMRWRSQEIHVDDDIIRSGEGGALADSQTGDNFAKKEGEDFLAQMRKGKSFLHGVDKEGRPINIVRVRLHKQGEQSDRAMERYTVFVIETARLVLRPPVETAVCSIRYSPKQFADVRIPDDHLRHDLLHPVQYGLRPPEIHDQSL